MNIPLCFADTQNCFKCAGLEVFFIEGGGEAQWGAPSAFFAFPNTVEANKAAQAILAQPCLGEALPGGKSAAAAAGSVLEVTFKGFDTACHTLLRLNTHTLIQIQCHFSYNQSLTLGCCRRGQSCAIGAVILQQHNRLHIVSHHITAHTSSSSSDTCY